MKTLLTIASLACVSGTFAAQLAHEPTLAITILGWALLLKMVADELPERTP